jgi:fluoride ion exporter CrcB/FEX
MSFDNINWLAVIVAGISSFIVGGIWYARPVFGNAWMKENQLTEEQIKSGNKGKIFGFTFLFSVLMAFILGLFLHKPDVSLHLGMMTGFHAGLLTFSAIAIHSLFELKSWKLIFINGGYSVIALTLMGAILGVWH